MAKKKWIACVLILFVCIMISGCWDMRELQDRNFVLAVAIDKADDVKEVETFVQPHGSKRYRVSLQILKLAAGAEQKDESRTFIKSNTGESMFEMIRDMLGQSSKSLWFEHLQVLIISDAVLKEVDLGEILDFFKRDSEMRSRIKVYVTSGKARPIIEFSPPSKEPGGVFLANLSRLHLKNLHVTASRTDLGYTVQHLDNKSDVILPRIEMVDKVVKLGGSAVFKKDRFIGYVDEYAVAGSKMMLGTEKSAVVTIDSPKTPGHQIVFELFRHDTTLTPHVENGSIYFTDDITMYGNIGEIQGDINVNDAMDPEYLRILEVAFAEEIKRNIYYTEKVLKKEMKVDAVGRFASKLKAHEPETWEQVKDQWDELYPTIPLYVSVNVTIRNIGSHK
ncbi:Ger(x)C family spore germination protein [Pelosinus sp. IPA-1]|uniref:Ger(x)C family spore germination protein n=1 Tax=Pelosinus sp. IPA-1 TaxID=3029569 RepID=UPI002436269F|nr:Ger(x)C family spore germination protein [Pelosinus sp. IPA-1]GMA99109.1 spore germination protein A3 [Pelosinus sp. IPA-1]